MGNRLSKFIVLTKNLVKYLPESWSIVFFLISFIFVPIVINAESVYLLFQIPQKVLKIKFPTFYLKNFNFFFKSPINLTYLPDFEDLLNFVDFKSKVIQIKPMENYLNGFN